MTSMKILLAGEGGQGIQTIAKVISDSAAKAGYNVSYIPSFGVEQRGTPSVGFIILSREPIFYPRFDLTDYAVILSQRSAEAISIYVSPRTKVIFDSSTVDPKSFPRTFTHLFGTPATKYAIEKFHPRSFNVIITGKLSQILGLAEKDVWAMIEKTLGAKFKDEKVRKANEDAFIFGRNLVFETGKFSDASFVPSTEKIVVKGYNKKGEILPSRCKGCGICIEKCPVKALKYGDILGVFATPVPDVDLEKCIACGNCRRFCPDSAINIEKDIKQEG